MSNRKKDKRRFRRYKRKLDFKLSLGGKSYSAATIDYSADGIGAEIEDSPPVQVGDVIGIDLSNLDANTKINGKVVWSAKGQGTTKLGLRRLGALSGSTSDYSLADVLIGLQRGRMTGVLVVTSGSIRKSLYLEDGDVIFATSSEHSDRLGNLLLSEGRITREQFDRASKIVVMQGKRLGAVLVEFGVLTPKELFNFVTRNVKHITESIFSLKDTEFMFDNGDLPTDEVIKLSLSVGNIIYQGVKRIQEPELISRECPSLDSVVRFSPDPRNLFQDLTLETSDKKLLKIIDGKKTVQDLIKSSGADELEALKSIYALLSAGLIEVSEDLEVGEDIPMDTVVGEADKDDYEKVAAKIMKLYGEHEKLGYYGVLGVDARADKGTIKRAYYNMAKEFHPDKHFHLPGDMKDKLNTLFTYITTAYTTLTDSSLRSQYDNSSETSANKGQVTGIEIASLRFREGIGELDRGNFDEAARLFGAAAYLEESVAKYHFYCGLALAKQNKHKEAEKALSRAIRAEPHKASYLAEAGHVYLALELPKRARGNFERALKIDPKNKRAMEGMEKLPDNI